MTHRKLKMQWQS